MAKRQKKMVRISSLRELAEAVGVSTASVSLVLNGKWHKKVKASIAEKILQLTAEHNFSLNPLGKGLTMKKYFRIALIIEGNMLIHPLLGTFSFHDFIANITHKLNKAGYSLDIIQVNPERYQRILSEKRISGLNDAYIFIGWQGSHVVELLNVLALKQPYIVFDTDLGDSSYSYIHKDFARQSCKAAEYFARNGHRAIAVIQGEDNPSRFHLKLKGFTAGLADHGIRLEKASVMLQTEPASISTGYESTLKLFEKKRKPTAIFCTDNICTIGVLWALDKLGGKVPDDVEIISYGDEAFAHQTIPSLSYIKIPSKEVAQYCIERIIEWTDGTHPFKPIQTCFEETLVFNGTTKGNM